MSINQEILDDLAKTTGVDPETLREAGVDYASPNPGVIVSPSVVSTDAETPITNEVRSKLLNPQTKFVEIQDGVETTTTMSELLQTVVENTTISSADVGRIVPRFEGFDKQFHPKSFTTEPSRVNYHLASSYMENKLKARCEQVCTQFDLFFTETLTDAEESFNLYRDFYASELTKGLIDFQARVAEWKSDPQHMDKQNILFGGDINAATADTKFCLEDSVLGKYFDGEAFSKFMMFVKDYHSIKTKNTLATPLIRAILDTMSIEDFISAEGRVNTYGQVFSCAELVETMSSQYLVKMLENFEGLVSGSIKSLYAIEADAKIDHKDFAQVRDFVVKNGVAIDDAAANCHYYAETIDTLRRLYLVASGILDYFTAEK